MGNFIKLDRKILKWEWWGDINTYRLFSYMLLSAYWKEGKYKGKDIPRGSFPSSILELSKETNLTENEIRTAIKHLKSTGEITSKSHGKFTVFTIKNYDKYQSDNEQNYNQITKEITNKSQSDNEEVTSKSHSVNELLTNTILKESNKVIREEDNQERKEEDNKKVVAKATKKKEPAVYYPNDELLNNAFNEFLVMRNKIKRPIATQQALTRMMNKIEKLSGGDNDLAVKILNQSTDHCWQDVYELKEDNWNNSYGACNKSNDVNANRQSQLDYLLDSIRRDEGK